MMSRKTLWGLFGALVVVVLLSMFTGRARYSTTEGGGFVTILDSFDPADAQSIKAWLGEFPDEPVVLTRSGDGWVVSSRWDWPAKEDLVKRLLDDLDNLKGEKRSSSANVLADFQADDSLGLHLTATGSAGGELFHLVVGKSSVRGGGFVRQEGSDEVFLTQAPLRSSFGVWGDEPKAPDPKRWIELRVEQADRQDVDRIVLHEGGKDIVLEKEFEMVAAEPAAPDTSGAGADSAAAPDTAQAALEPKPDRSKWTWKPDAAGEFDKAKADGILSTVCSVYAFDVADPDSVASYGLDDPSQSVEVFFQDSDPVTIQFGKETEDGKKVYFRVAPDGKPATIYKTTVDRLFPSRADLKPQA